MIIAIETEKAIDKVQHPFMLKKTLNNMRLEGILLNIVKIFIKSLWQVFYSKGKLN